MPTLTVAKSALLALTAALATAAGAQQRPYYLTPDEMGAVAGSYELSNGDMLRVSREQRRYWGEMANTGRIELVPVDSIVFVARGASMRFTFTPLPFTTEVRVDGLGAPHGAAPPSGIERKFGE